MKLCSTILLVAAFETLWLQNVLTGLIPNPSPAGGLKTEDSLTDLDSIVRYYITLKGTTNSKETGANISWGSNDVQTSNVYSENEGKEILYGPRDILIGNNFTKNSKGTNMYGPILVQKNNVYHGKGEKVLYGASVTQIDNIYPKNPGNQDIYGPVVIQEDNIYPENSGNNTVFGAIVNRTNNTYPKTAEGNKDALKPIIYQSGKVYPPTSNTNRVVGAVVKENGSSFHPSQGHYERHVAGMVKRRYEYLIDHHLRTDKPTLRRCTDGMMDLGELDQIESLYFTVEKLAAQRKALQEIKRNRKTICDSIGNQCSKHADMQNWITSSRRIVKKATKQSRKRWESLRKC